MSKQAKELYDIVESLGEGLYKEGFHIYPCDMVDGKAWRCDMAELGGFAVYRYDSYEEYSLSLDDWITLEQPWYCYSDLGELYEDYPQLPIEIALEKLQTVFQTQTP